MQTKAVKKQNTIKTNTKDDQNKNKYSTRYTFHSYLLFTENTNINATKDSSNTRSRESS